jgi:hypothetical protein
LIPIHSRNPSRSLLPLFPLHQFPSLSLLPLVTLLFFLMCWFFIQVR